jgi:hypothetical protein
MRRWERILLYFNTLVSAVILTGVVIFFLQSLTPASEASHEAFSVASPREGGSSSSASSSPDAGNVLIKPNQRDSVEYLASPHRSEPLSPRELGLLPRLDKPAVPAGTSGTAPPPTFYLNPQHATEPPSEPGRPAGTPGAVPPEP